MTNSVTTESDFPDKFMSKPARLWCYMLCIAVCVVLGTLGVINNDYIAVINYALAAFFGVAVQNIPRITANGAE